MPELSNIEGTVIGLQLARECFFSFHIEPYRNFWIIWRIKLCLWSLFRLNAIAYIVNGGLFEADMYMYATKLFKCSKRDRSRSNSWYMHTVPRRRPSQDMPFWDIRGVLILSKLMPRMMVYLIYNRPRNPKGMGVLLHDAASSSWRNCVNNIMKKWNIANMRCFAWSHIMYI